MDSRDGLVVDAEVDAEARRLVDQLDRLLEENESSPTQAWQFPWVIAVGQLASEGLMMMNSVDSGVGVARKAKSQGRLVVDASRRQENQTPEGENIISE